MTKTQKQNPASRDPPLRIRPAGSAALQPKTQRRREKQYQYLVALTCENPEQTYSDWGLLVLSGEAGTIRGFLCASASLRENIAFTE
jgi:hypothetical protein